MIETKIPTIKETVLKWQENHFQVFNERIPLRKMAYNYWTVCHVQGKSISTKVNVEAVNLKFTAEPTEN